MGGFLLEAVRPLKGKRGKGFDEFAIGQQLVALTLRERLDNPKYKESSEKI